jgi:hypothetical protein
MPMTTAAAPHLRPLGLGELLDQAIRLYRRNFLKFIGIIAVVQIPLALLQLLVSLSTVGGVVARAQNPSSVSPDDPLSAFGPGYFAGIGVGLLLGLISFILVQGIAAAATARAVADSYLGEPTGMVEAYRKIGRAWGSILGALLMVVLLFAALLLWTVIPCIGWFTGFGLLFFFAAVIVPLIAPVIVLENQRAAASIRRAWDLARRRFWWTLGFVFILYIFSLLIIAGPTTLLTFLMQSLLGNPLQSGNASDLFTLQTVIQSLSSLVLSLLYLPLQVTCITLMYFDLRVRTEGFDLALSAESALGAQAGTAALTLPAPPPESKGLVTWPELGYFALIELMAVGLYCGLSFVFGALIFAAMAASGLGP